MKYSKYNYYKTLCKIPLRPINRSHQLPNGVTFSSARQSSS